MLNEDYGKFPVGSLWINTTWELETDSAPARFYHTYISYCLMILERDSHSSVKVLLDKGKVVLLNIADLEVYYKRIYFRRPKDLVIK